MTTGPDSTLANLWLSSPNIDERRGESGITLLLLHYTGTETAEQALDWLTCERSSVSCHYLVDENGRITQMVQERMRAWHAGVSNWAGETDINSCSIGIEIHNRGHDMDYPDFPEAQMQAVEKLCLDILSRHPIPPNRVLAHSDVAPGRKIDPGEKFDWERLHRAGIGLWVEQVSCDSAKGLAPGDQGRDVETLQTLLSEFGYGIEAMGYYGTETEKIVRAFQRHFRPARVDGRADRSTREMLAYVLEGTKKMARRT